MPSKSPAQIAYEKDVARQPRYLDGELRPSWDKLRPVAVLSWEMNPTPRNWTNTTETR